MHKVISLWPKWMRLTKTLKFFAVSFSILVRSFLTYRTTFLKFFFVITLCFSNDLYFKLWKTNCFSSTRTFLILFLSSIHFSQTKFAHSTTNQPLLFFLFLTILWPTNINQSFYAIRLCLGYWQIFHTSMDPPFTPKELGFAIIRPYVGDFLISLRSCSHYVQIERLRIR